MEIRQATQNDAQGILKLLQENHVDNITDPSDGFVTTNMTLQQLETLITKENGVTIAVEQDRIVAFAMVASWEFWSEWQFFAYMIERLSTFSFEGQTLTVENSYQYGPVCVDQQFRGTGVFEQVFAKSLASMQARYPIMATFINQINHRSFAAHTKKVGMTQVGTFHFNQNNYYLMACRTARETGKEGQ